MVFQCHFGNGSITKTRFEFDFKISILQGSLFLIDSSWLSDSASFCIGTILNGFEML